MYIYICIAVGDQIKHMCFGGFALCRKYFDYFFGKNNRNIVFAYQIKKKNSCASPKWWIW